MITVDFNCLRLPAGCRVLDIGCGAGRHVAAAYALDRAVVIGADTDPANLQQTKSRLIYHDRLGVSGKGSWALTSADATRLPFADNCYDLVICSEVLEHIHDHQQALRELARIVKPGGHIIVSVPRRWPETVCWALSRQYRHTQGGHLRIYCAHRLIENIEAQGFHHWRTHYAHSLHTPYWWLKCLIGLQRDRLLPVLLYHRFLTWDIMKQPRVTRFLDHFLNPLMGKSVVMYFRKPV